MSFKSILLALALVVVLASSALASSAMSGGKATVHFFAIPESVPATELAKLNGFLSQAAGGFTAMRSQGGSMVAGVSEIHENNMSYLVAADRNLSKEIMAYAKEKLGLGKLFILVWKADRPGQ